MGVKYAKTSVPQLRCGTEWSLLSSVTHLSFQVFDGHTIPLNAEDLTFSCRGPGHTKGCVCFKLFS